MKKTSDLSVIIVAAGCGKRLSGQTCGLPKQFYKINGLPLVYYSMAVFDRLDFVSEIILVLPAGAHEIIRKHFSGMGFLKKIKKLSAIATGGERRQDSVANALGYIGRKSKYVAVHDAARPFVTAEDISKTYGYAKKYGACVLGADSKNTMKIVDEKGFIKSTPKRALIKEAYTPQIFKKDLLFQAYDHAREKKITATDDASLVEALLLGVIPAKAGIYNRIYLYSGSPDNIKITDKTDMILLRKLSHL